MEDLILLERRVTYIEDFIFLSDVEEVWSPTAALSGLGSGVISTGFTHNFWGIGNLDHSQTLTNGTTYYLIYGSQYEPLTYYVGESTLGTLWIETPGTPARIYTMPIRFDATGIYFRPSEQLTNLPVGTSFKFTQALILVGPEDIV